LRKIKANHALLRTAHTSLPESDPEGKEKDMTESAAGDGRAGLETAARSRDERLRWWREARFGLVIHWGLYAQLARGEWVMNRDCIPLAEYEPLADSWHPKAGFARDWARLARRAGMKYAVLTTKHHEGFCLWDSRQTDYNAARRGPGRDLVREYVDAFRAEGLRVGLYYSLMDWHHPDGVRCAENEAARRRFLDFSQGCVRELMTHYGKIDLLFYDVSWPLPSAAAWESEKLNAMVRRLQPDIIVNNRSMLEGDYGTPEGEVKAVAGRDWESCITFNDGEWGFAERVPEDWYSVRDLLRMLRTCAAEGGNLLLNVGPMPDGTLDPLAVERLEKLGAWLQANGEAVYGPMTPIAGKLEPWASHGFWTLKGNCAYLWNLRSYPRGELLVGGLQPPVTRISILGTGQELSFEQKALQLRVRGIPAVNPDAAAETPVFKFEFGREPRQAIGMGCSGRRSCLGGHAAAAAAAANAAAAETT